MKNSNYVLGALLAVLVLLIISVDFKFSLPNFSYGQIVASVKSVTKSQVSKPISASLTNSTPSFSEMVFVGDVLLARNVEVLMKRYGADYPFGGIDIKDFTTQNPAVIANFEASIPETHIPTEALKMNFSVDKMFLPAAKKAGITHFSLANNHSFDSDKLGFLNTKSKLEENGFMDFGNPNAFSTQSVTFIKVEEKSVAVIGLQAIEQSPSDSQIKKVLDYASNNSDIQIVYVHWGIEYDELHSKSQRKLAEKLVHNGADLIVGHHPHVVQDIELIDGALVFYSLGNYIFDQYFSTPVQQGLMLKLSLSNIGFVELFPVTSEGHLSQPSIASQKQTEQILSNIAKRSSYELKDSILEGIIPLDIKVASSSKIAMMVK